MQMRFARTTAINFDHPFDWDKMICPRREGERTVCGLHPPCSISFFFQLIFLQMTDLVWTIKEELSILRNRLGGNEKELHLTDFRRDFISNVKCVVLYFYYIAGHRRTYTSLYTCIKLFSWNTVWMQPLGNMRTHSLL